MEWDLAQILVDPWAQVALVLAGVALILILLYWLISLGVRHIRLKRSLRLVFLEVKIPRYPDEDVAQKDEKKDMKETVAVMEQFFKVLYGTVPRSFADHVAGRQYFGVEMVARDGELRFYFVVPHDKQQSVEKQITSYYDDAVVERVSDPNIFSKGSKVAVGYFEMKKQGYYPIRTFQKMDHDPLNNLTNVFSKLNSEEGVTLQILFTPVSGNFRRKGKERAREIFEGKSGSGSLWPVRVLVWILKLVTLQFESLTQKKNDEERRATPQEEEQVKAIEEKAAEVGYSAVLRLISAAPGKERAKHNLRVVANAFSQFAEPDLNEFVLKEPRDILGGRGIRKFVESYLFRYAHKHGVNVVLSPKEMASVFHLPHPKYNTAPVIKWQNSQVASAPPNLPRSGMILGHNIYRGESRPIRISHEDRFRHFYIVGQTGTGKSVGLINMILQDMQEGRGICVMDPHGSLAKDVMKYVPRERAEDVIYFNASDTERPMGMNLLEAETDDEKDLVAMEALNIMIKLYGEEIFSPRLQDYFRNAVLTLMDDHEEGGSLIDVVPLFTNKAFQRYKRSKIKNPIVKDWWDNTFDAMGDREKEEMIPYFAAKFGAFVTNTTMRNILGQTKSAFDFGKAMQEGKIILVNLSKGLIGDLNTDLLGMIIVSKIQAAAMRREAIPKEERRDFFLYIDEFQNFITESIESILSEARKYRLGMIMAHQYIGQLEESGPQGMGDKIKKAVFGNVGSLWSYKVSAEDAKFLEEEFKPVFTSRDLNNLDIFHACLKLTIDGVQTPPFSIVARKYWEVPEFSKNPDKITDAISELSRLQWGRDKKFVTTEILGRLGI